MTPNAEPHPTAAEAWYHQHRSAVLKALHFCPTQPGDLANTDRQLKAQVSALRELLGDDDTTFAVLRAIGQSLDRMACWHTQIADEHLTHHNVANPAALTALTDALSTRVTALTNTVLPSYLHREAEQHSAHRYNRAPATRDVASVGFCDLVSFTQLVAQSTEAQLARLVHRFETTVTDVVIEHGGRVVKTVGDEVLFETWEVPTATRIALALATLFADHPTFPKVRTAVATGPILERLGDVFGTTVNRAHRLCSHARPDQVIVDERTAANITADYRAKPLGRIALRGLGWCQPYQVSHHPGAQGHQQH